MNSETKQNSISNDIFANIIRMKLIESEKMKREKPRFK